MIATGKRIELLDKLGKYMLSDNEEWQHAQQRATTKNAWFTQEHISEAVRNIALEYLQKDKLEEWMSSYKLPESIRKVGIVTAGNIPLVGFHDVLCGLLSGHNIHLKLSSKDDALIAHLLKVLSGWDEAVAGQITIAEQLKNCDAYIATGSNNTARYFEQYFGKYPHIIRKNRTSVAILVGDETDEELLALGKDVFTYFGLGCRNVTQLCVPEGYDFFRLLQLFEQYDSYALHHKYKNNYDYHYAIYLLNRVPHFTNGSLLLVENELPFSAVSVLHYRYYNDARALAQRLQHSEEIQTIVGRDFTSFGTAQLPSLYDYADRVDTMAFLCSLK